MGACAGKRARPGAGSGILGSAAPAGRGRRQGSGADRAVGSGTEPWRGGAVTAPRGSGQEGGNPHGASRRLPPRGRRGSPRAGPECDVARACFPCAPGPVILMWYPIQRRGTLYRKDHSGDNDQHGRGHPRGRRRGREHHPPHPLRDAPALRTQRRLGHRQGRGRGHRRGHGRRPPSPGTATRSSSGALSRACTTTS